MIILWHDPYCSLIACVLTKRGRNLKDFNEVENDFPAGKVFLSIFLFTLNLNS